MSTGFSKVRVTELLNIARSRRASDVHVAAGSVTMFRIDGSLEKFGAHVVSFADAESLVNELLDDEQRIRLRDCGDLTCTIDFPEIGIVRAHASAANSGPCLALRLLGSAIPALHTLGLPEAVRGFANAAHGLVLLSGATGCGKSTTLAALIECINTSAARRIVEIEDPIEFRHTSKRSLITQREIGRDVESFSVAILAALRMDPDVIVIGEMREAATMQAALLAAETGHLVFGTLHAGYAAQAIDRIIDAFVETAQAQVQTQLAQALLGIVCQRLETRATGHGRRAIAEILVATDAVRNVIRERKTHLLQNIMAMGRSTGMQTFDQHRSDVIERGDPELALV